MSDSPTVLINIIGALYDYARWLLLVVIGLFSWKGRKIFEDVEMLKRDTIKKSDFNESMHRLEKSIGKMHDDMRHNADKSENSINKLRDDVGKDIRSIHSRFDRSGP